MSGHSKWAQIHRQKGAADTKRGALFTKLGNAITIAAKSGGGNPEANFKLRLAIDQAKAANMPKDNIERAIIRGTGEIAGGRIEEVEYEGFGPEGTAFIIECLTDNRNRTSSAIKHILTKYGGSLAGPNSVKWLFSQKAAIHVGKISEELELELIDAGAQDISKDMEGSTIYAQPNDLKKIKDFLEGKNIAVEYAEIEWVPNTNKNVTDIKAFEKIYAELEENEDVNNYYSNAKI
ncbi:MAG: YebC/PmpR family DNA-binding transcriptional regulator [Candidatus Magasanikbacteria bacterium]|nr:YebC/PmpR family DNA-binding transcriptional regulator [Candidatus Magasanikbacteria bacterium]